MKKFLGIVGILLLVGASILNLVWLTPVMLKQQAFDPLKMIIVGVLLEIAFALLFPAWKKNKSMRITYKIATITVGIVILLSVILYVIRIVL